MCNNGQKSWSKRGLIFNCQSSFYCTVFFLLLKVSILLLMLLNVSLTPSLLWSFLYSCYLFWVTCWYSLSIISSISFRSMELNLITWYCSKQFVRFTNVVFCGSFPASIFFSHLFLKHYHCFKFFCFFFILFHECVWNFL